MKIKGLLIAFAVVIVGCSPAEQETAQAPQVAQAAEAPAGNDIPRTPSGKPDFNSSRRLPKRPINWFQATLFRFQRQK
jgi:PBP1b-binding outer membrane lipoprotein LpoB